MPHAALCGTLPQNVERGGDPFLQLLARLELHSGTGGNMHVLARVLRIASDLGLRLPHMERPEPAHGHRVAVGQTVRDPAGQRLGDPGNDVMCDADAPCLELAGDGIDEFLFVDRGHGVTGWEGLDTTSRRVVPRKIKIALRLAGGDGIRRVRREAWETKPCGRDNGPRPKPPSARRMDPAKPPRPPSRCLIPVGLDPMAKTAAVVQTAAHEL